MSEEAQGASTLPQGAGTLPHGASTPRQGASTLPHCGSTLQGTSTPQGANALPHGASTPQGASTSPPLVASSPIVAQLTATRSPSLLAARTRKRERLDNFFKGKARAAYRLSPELDGSLSGSETSLTGAQALEGRGERCHRGCTEVLGQLVDIFHAIGRHNAKTEATYSKSYPKQGDYINISGKSIEKVASS